MKSRTSVVLTVVWALSMIPAVVAASAQTGKPPKVKITAKQADEIALKKYPGKIQGKTPLENEAGKWQYGVMVRSGKTLREVMVNAQTGKIDSVEVTTEAKEKAEKRADESKPKKTKQ